SKSGELEGARGGRRVDGGVAAPRNVQVDFRTAYETTVVRIGDVPNDLCPSERDLEVSSADDETNLRVSLARLCNQFRQPFLAQLRPMAVERYIVILCYFKRSTELRVCCPIQRTDIFGSHRLDVAD